MKKTKKISNADLLKEIKKLEQELEKYKASITFIPQPFPFFPDHSHCVCKLCHPDQYTHYYPFTQPYSPPYIVSSGGTNNVPAFTHFEGGING